MFLKTIKENKDQWKCEHISEGNDFEAEFRICTWMCVFPNLLCLPKHVYKCKLKLCSSRVWEKSAMFPAVVTVTWAFQLFFGFRFTDKINILYIFNLHFESFLNGAPSRVHAVSMIHFLISVPFLWWAFSC